ncbi:MAG: tetratricopeptide repeat protein, partial [Kamptonema sp. SIO4C4]|nr:tetratricopeptide repeat protein [Kamptonema sp. SIO4C4]
ASPPLIEALRDFALSTVGPDKLRNEAGSIASQEGYLPSGKVKMWLRGEWKEILLIGMKIHDQPYGGKHSQKVQSLLRQGTQALRNEDGEQAEHFLNQALQLEPEAIDLSFNLAIAYQMQDRQADMVRLLHELYDRDPNYPFVRTALAQLLIDTKELDGAEAILQPMIQWREMHFQAFSAFCQTQIEWHLAKKLEDDAKSWLGIWRQVEPDHPNLAYWQDVLDNPSRIDWELSP